MMNTLAPPITFNTIADPSDASRRILAIVGASSGNLVEWYDFYAYTFTSLYFAAAFFPSGDRTSQLLATAGIFAAGFSCVRSEAGCSGGSATVADPPEQADGRQ